MRNNHTNNEFKRLLKEHRNYLSDVVKRFNKSRTAKEKAWKIQLIGRKLGRLTADLYNLQGQIYPEGG